MHTELRITEDHWNDLRGHLLQDGQEHAAMLMCGSHVSENATLLLTREVVSLTQGDLEETSTSFNLRIRPDVIARLAKTAGINDGTLVLCHSHPFEGPVTPSLLDLETEADLCGRVLVSRLSPRPVGALIAGYEGWNGRVWSETGAAALHRVRVLGPVVRTLREEDPEGTYADDVDRQVRAWGAAGQVELGQAHVVVVGAGGTGSHVVQQLAHLGIGKLTLVDDDLVDVSNLSRIVGAQPQDVGKRKVDVLAQAATNIRRDLRVCTVAKSVLDIGVDQLVEADFVMCCTDSQSSRALLTELAVQYLVPVVDMGVEVQPSTDVLRAGGGVRVLLPGSWCLHCAATINYHLVREECLSPAQRAVEDRRGYLRGADEPAPSVISLNGVVASLAVLELCHLVTGFLGQGSTRLLYRGESRQMSTATVQRDQACYVCGCDGVLALGDARPLPLREENPCIQ